jgi:hypothetical protein
VLHAALVVFWLGIFAAFTIWVLFDLPPHSRQDEEQQQDEDREPEDVPLAA